MKTLDILPVFLQEGHQEVHGEPHVLDQLVLGHLNIAHGHAQAEDLLHLELDGGLQVVDLGLHVVGVGDHGGELASFVEARAQQPGVKLLLLSNLWIINCAQRDEFCVSPDFKTGYQIKIFLYIFCCFLNLSLHMRKKYTSIFSTTSLTWGSA